MESCRGRCAAPKSFMHQCNKKTNTHTQTRKKKRSLKSLFRVVSHCRPKEKGGHSYNTLNLPSFISLRKRTVHARRAVLRNNRARERERERCVWEKKPKMAAKGKMEKRGSRHREPVAPIAFPLRMRKISFASTVITQQTATKHLPTHSVRRRSATASSHRVLRPPSETRSAPQSPPSAAAA